jgi:DNA-binding SARP family transcriptional activator
LTAQRVVAFVAVSGRPVRRDYLAGMLWPDSSEGRANGSLRSALWRLQRSAPRVVFGLGSRLALAPNVAVDFHDAVARAHRVLHPVAATDLDAMQDPSDFALDLLPDWYDDWLIDERERLRQLQLHALEAISRHLREGASFGAAVEAAQIAVAFEPTRESARRALIAAHLAEGNVDQAIREFIHFRDLLRRELGVEPSPMLRALLPSGVAGHLTAARAEPPRQAIPQ